MSTKLNSFAKGFLTFFTLFLALFSIGYISADFFMDSRSRVQSTTMSSVLMNAKMGKSLAFVNVQLEPVEIPDGPNEVAEISGYVTLLKSSSNTINYQWILPEGVNIVEGDQQGQIESVVVESPIEIKIKVTGYTRSEKKLISLSASTKIAENVFSNVAILSSRPEDSHEFIAKQRFELKQIEQVDLSSKSPEDLRSAEKIQR